MKLNKNIFFKLFLTIFLLFFVVNHFLILFAQEELKESTASVEKQIEEFKEKIATKVAQLQKNQQKKALSGFIIEVTEKTFKIITDYNQEYNVKLDDVISKYYQIKGNRIEEIDKKDIKKNDYIIISGLISDKEINANSIYKDENFFIGKGSVIEVNKDEYYLKVINDEKEEFLLDIETSTKKLMVNIKTFDFEKIGFSKIKEGDVIHFIIKKTSSEKKNRYSAEKIIILPQEFFLLPSN